MRLGTPEAAIGHEQAKERPALIVSADFVNRSRADMVIVVPLTTAERLVRSHVRVMPPEGGVSASSSIQCEQIRAISSERLIQRLGAVNAATMEKVEYVLKLLLALP